MQPHDGQSQTGSTAASRAKTSAPEIGSVPAMPVAEQAPLPTIDETVITTPTPAAATNPSSVVTTTPQPTNNTSVTDLQSANGKAGSSEIEVPTKTKATKTFVKVKL